MLNSVLTVLLFH